jgi:hypothetical protein
MKPGDLQPATSSENSREVSGPPPRRMRVTALGPDLTRRSKTMVPSMSSEDGPAAAFADDMAVMVGFPRTKQEEQGDRAAWPWLPGTIVQQCGPDEFQIVVEDMAVAVRQDGSRPTPRTPKNKLFYPLCFRDSSEIKLAGGAR